MNITLFSRHIPKDSFDGSNIIMHDLRVFGDAMHSAFALSQKDKNFGKTRKEQNLPDRRTMEGRKSKSNEQPSVFIQVKEKYGFSTYFANSVLQESSAILRSVKELHADNVKGVKDKLSQVEKKLKKSAKRLKELEKTKKCLINISKGNKHTKLRMPKGSVETYDKEKGCFYIWKYNPKTSIRILTKTYSDSYQFETQYLTPKIKMLKHRINSLENRIHHLEHKLEKMEQISGVCFGGKKLFKKQFGDCYPDHETWRKAFHKRRYHGMTISGRRNSNDGNYVFRYELKTHNLFYTAMNREEVCIPNVVFPRGQEILDAYLIRQKTTHEAPIAWRIEDTGGSFLIKCVLHLPEPKYKNYSYDCGCIGMDTNLQFSL